LPTHFGRFHLLVSAIVRGANSDQDGGVVYSGRPESARLITGQVATANRRDEMAERFIGFA
jgi:hypothetical protein